MTGADPDAAADPGPGKDSASHANARMLDDALRRLAAGEPLDPDMLTPDHQVLGTPPGIPLPPLERFPERREWLWEQGYRLIQGDVVPGTAGRILVVVLWKRLEAPERRGAAGLFFVAVTVHGARIHEIRYFESRAAAEAFCGIGDLP